MPEPYSLLPDITALHYITVIHQPAPVPAGLPLVPRLHPTVVPTDDQVQGGEGGGEEQHVRHRHLQPHTAHLWQALNPRVIELLPLIKLYPHPLPPLAHQLPYTNLLYATPRSSLHHLLLLHLPLWHLFSSSLNLKHVFASLLPLQHLFSA